MATPATAQATPAAARTRKAERELDHDRLVAELRRGALLPGTSNIGGKAFANWLDSWLPRDVGVLLQDGCGVYARGPAAAREYADALAAHLGKKRVRIIAEAFRPRQGGGFRSATAAGLAPQLEAYHGYRVYVFDGPHYLSPELVDGLLAIRHGAGKAN